MEEGDGWEGGYSRREERLWREEKASREDTAEQKKRLEGKGGKSLVIKRRINR